MSQLNHLAAAGLTNDSPAGRRVGFAMILQRRFRTALVALAFYGAAGGIVTYFWWHAHHGDRGLHAKSVYKLRIAELNQEILEAKKEKADWERRVALLRADSLDRDILEERARQLLNGVHRNDVVVVAPR
jgi:cell division protein FtsB